MIDVFVIKTNKNLSQQEIVDLSKCISVEKQNKNKQLYFVRDRQNTLLADLLIRMEICKRTGNKNHHLLFSSNRYQKPYCINTPEIHYNISHSECYVVCAISDEPIGIDIELVKEIDLNLAQRFFTLDEYLYVSNASTELQKQLFYEIWTKKESYIKYQGNGLSIPLNSFSVLSRSNDVYYRSIKINEEVICYVCSKNSKNIVCKIVDVEQVISFFL